MGSPKIVENQTPTKLTKAKKPKTASKTMAKERVDRNKQIAENLSLSSKAGDIKGITVRPSGKWVRISNVCSGQ